MTSKPLGGILEFIIRSMNNLLSAISILLVMTLMQKITGCDNDVTIISLIMVVYVRQGHIMDKLKVK